MFLAFISTLGVWLGGICPVGISGVVDRVDVAEQLASERPRKKKIKRGKVQDKRGIWNMGMVGNNQSAILSGNFDKPTAKNIWLVLSLHLFQT